ncbi:MAG: DUF3999 family protein [Verrucomicrobiales bacterium]|nr:DUF3999 family protein [Verrucomicrobiales bacterium]
MAATLALSAEVNPADWRWTQSIDVQEPGLVRVALPPATLDVLRAGLADLRLLDSAGTEVAWVQEHPMRVATSSSVRRPKAFTVSLQPQSTVVTLETDLTHPVEGIALGAGDGSFLKAVKVEASPDARSWQLVAKGLPIYQNYQGQTRRQVTFPAVTSRWLRLTLDDSRSAPVPITEVQVQELEPGREPALERTPVRIVLRDELPRETRLRLDLGFANRDVASLEISCPDPYFTRRASVRERRFERGEWSERILVSGLLHREPLPDGTAGPPARLEIDTPVATREVVLVIENGDSPQLPVTSITVVSRPVDLLFWARTAGSYRLLAGNTECPAPRYDFATFADRLAAARPQTASLGSLEPNALFHPPPVAPDPFNLGGPLDVSPWHYRKPVSIAREGAQELELDLEVITGAQPGLGDLRLVSEGRQRPYILEPKVSLRTLVLSPVPADDPKRPGVSQWRLALPRDGIPLRSLELESSTPLFEREVTLLMETSGPRGERVRTILASAVWRRTPGTTPGNLVLSLDGRPAGGSLWLEVHNGDNAPLVLSTVTGFYAVGRLHFLAPVNPATTLYYGNPSASSPVYDLQLIAARVVNAPASVVVTGPGELNHAPSPARSWTKASGGIWIFWSALAVVVACLLLVLRRILPAT